MPMGSPGVRVHPDGDLDAQHGHVAHVGGQDELIQAGGRDALGGVEDEKRHRDDDGGQQPHVPSLGHDRT